MVAFVSIIIPVKNEEGVLGRCLKSLSDLEYPKDKLEVIIADGLSTDDSRKIALAFNVKVVENTREIVSSGRNAGFRSAQGDIIVFTDADCVFDANWLKNAVKYFDDDRLGGVGGITLSPDNSSSFEKAVDVLFQFAEIFQSTSHRKGFSGVMSSDDIPGCNAFYRRAALEKVMPIDENLLTAEDSWLNFCLRNSGYKLILAPDVILWHYRRNSPKKFLRQMYRFAVGRLQAGKKKIRLLKPLHILVGFSIPVFLLLGLCFYLSHAADVFLKIILLSAVAMISAAWSKTKSLRAALDMPLVSVIFLAGWSSGFLRELLYPLKDAKGK